MQNSPDVQGFDLEAWKKDKKGCNSTRASLLNDFEKKVKPQLEGLSEIEIVKILGKADYSLLAERNQKFYRYYLEEGEQCGKNKKARYVQIRFSALNVVNEITVVYY
ncbi:MAG: hypothetical protein MUE81_13545 [Thermoflexibacter sp.]|jgi:hypothetical protein|nr:hypothetical protein [Thermoflexibacter sp.]